MFRPQNLLKSFLHVLKNLLLFVVFWTDWQTMGIQSVDKRSGLDLHLHVGGLVRPTGIKTISEERQPMCRSSLFVLSWCF